MRTKWRYERYDCVKVNRDNGVIGICSDLVSRRRIVGFKMVSRTDIIKVSSFDCDFDKLASTRPLCWWNYTLKETLGARIESVVMSIMTTGGPTLQYLLPDNKTDQRINPKNKK